jgi:trk system potassium uptake protein TrkA
MKIIILGAGQVGRTLAENLANEANDVTMVDQDAGHLKDLQVPCVGMHRFPIF